MKRIPIIKLVSIFCALTLALVTLPAISRPATAEDITVCKFDAGNGTETSPYEISTAVQLACLATQTNAGNADFNSQYYLQTLDLDLSAYRSGTGWVPIGAYSDDGSDASTFQGNYNGQNHTISNLKINRPNSGQGLFGYVTGGSIANLNLSGFSMTHSKTNEVYVGFLVGSASHSSTTISISNVSVLSGTATARSGATGGIAGLTNHVVISNVSNDGTVSNQHWNYAGGIVGYSQDATTIFNAYNAGIVYHGGGIVGVSEGSTTIVNVYNIGTSVRAGIVSLAYGDTTISNAYNTGNASVGGIVSVAYGDTTISNAYNAGNVSDGAGIVGLVNSSVIVSDVVNVGTAYVGGITSTYSGSNRYGGIARAYNSGTVSGSGHLVGGIVGSMSSGNVSNVLNLGDVIASIRATGILASDYTSDGKAVASLFNWVGASGGKTWPISTYQPFPDTGTSGFSYPSYHGKTTYCQDFFTNSFWTDADKMNFSTDVWDISNIANGYLPHLKFLDTLGASLGRPVPFSEAPIPCMTQVTTHAANEGVGVPVAGSGVTQTLATTDVNTTVYRYPANLTTLSYKAQAADGYYVNDWTLSKMGTATTGVNFSVPPATEIFTLDATNAAQSLRADQSLSVNFAEVSVGTTYGITYVLNGGSNDPGNPDTYYYMASDEITLLDPTINGYDFVGWYTDAEFTHSQNVIPVGSAGNKTFWAKWKATDWNITYNLDGGALDGNNPSSYNIETLPLTLSEPSKNGYHFDGWYSEPGFTNRFDFIPVGHAGDLPLWAKWSLISYNIIYELNGAEPVFDNPSTYDIESDEITLLDPTLNGYDFVGWYTDAEFTHSQNVIPAGSAGNITFWAKWVDPPVDPTPELPAECEAGYTGVYPDCVPIVPPPADECPEGSTGTPPFCQSIPPPADQCPAGSTGTPPFCQLIPPPADKPNDIPPSTSTDSLPSIPIDIPLSTVPTISSEPIPPATAISTTLDTQVTENYSECQLEKLICQFPSASGVALAFTDTSKIEKVRRSDIDWLSKTGVTIGSGCDLTQAGGGSNCKYLPANPVNRGAMAQFLQKLAGWTDSQISGTYSGQSSKFTDTAVIKSKNLSRYYAILWLADTGITVGCSATKFCPDNPVNRGAMAEFMQKFAGVSPAPANQSDFPDVSTKAVTLKYASSKKTTKVPALNQNRIGAINWLASTKITVGSGESAGKVTYKPQDLVNRGSMAQFLHRLANVITKGSV